MCFSPETRKKDIEKNILIRNNFGTIINELTL